MPGAQLRKAMKPLVESIIAEIQKADKITQQDLDAVANQIIKGVQHKVTVEEKTTHNTVIQKAEVPKTLVEIVQLLTDVVSREPAPERLRLADYRPHDQDEAGDIEYYGFVHPTGHWYIMKNWVKLNRERYIAGAGDYENAWDRRTKTKDYLHINEAFDYEV